LFCLEESLRCIVDSIPLSSLILLLLLYKSA